MLKIPDEFGDLPEAAKLREAQIRFKAAAERGKDLAGTSREQMGVIGGELRQAQEGLKRAQAEFDAATGEPKPVGLTAPVVEEVTRLFSAQQRDEVMSLMDRACGRTIPFHREATAEELERIRLCVLRLSGGNLGKLRDWIELANIDARDVLHAAAIHPQRGD